MRSVHIIITGHVQGVFFRASAKRKADALRIHGWVRNAGRDVEIKASGEEDAILDLLAWCHEGSQAAQVESVIVTDISAENFDGFSIRR